jgi:hypothetical protein
MPSPTDYAWRRSDVHCARAPRHPWLVYPAQPIHGRSFGRFDEITYLVENRIRPYPTIGGPISYVIVVAILYWRIGKEALTDILISVAVSRLAMLPVLLLIAKPH